MVNSKTELLQLQVRLLMAEEDKQRLEAQKEKLAKANKAKADFLLRTIKMQLSRTN